MDEKLFMDEIGHIFPSNLNKEEKSRVYSWAEKLHQILQLNHITTHTEFRIGRNGDIILIEIEQESVEIVSKLNEKQLYSQGI